MNMLRTPDSTLTVGDATFMTSVDTGEPSLFASMYATARNAAALLRVLVPLPGYAYLAGLLVKLHGIHALLGAVLTVRDYETQTAAFDALRQLSLVHDAVRIFNKILHTARCCVAVVTSKLNASFSLPPTQVVPALESLLPSDAYISLAAVSTDTQRLHTVRLWSRPHVAAAVCSKLEAAGWVWDAKLAPPNPLKEVLRAQVVRLRLATQAVARGSKRGLLLPRRRGSPRSVGAGAGAGAGAGVGAGGADNDDEITQDNVGTGGVQEGLDANGTTTGTPAAATTALASPPVPALEDEDSGINVFKHAPGAHRGARFGQLQAAGYDDSTFMTFVRTNAAVTRRTLTQSMTPAPPMLRSDGAPVPPSVQQGLLRYVSQHHHHGPASSSASSSATSSSSRAAVAAAAAAADKRRAGSRPTAVTITPLPNEFPFVASSSDGRGHRGM